MNLQDQVCSLELAKKLKGLEVKQDSWCCWWTSLANTFESITNKASFDKELGENNRYSTFTAAKLGEVLPAERNGFVLRRDKLLEKGNYHWQIAYWELGHDDKTRGEVFSDSSETNARAQMLVFLLENKLINLN